MTVGVDILAYNCGWEKWGCQYIIQIPDGELYIDLDFKEFGYRDSMRNKVLKRNLKQGNIVTLIKLFGIGK